MNRSAEDNGVKQPDRPGALASTLAQRFGAPVPVVDLGSGASLGEIEAQRLLDAPAGIVTGERADEVTAALATHGIGVDFTGIVGRGDHRAMVVTTRESGSADQPPEDFRVLAIIVAYNEADVIRPCVEYLVDQGVDVHLIDNWSTDGTVDEIRHLVGSRVSVERFPPDGPPLHVEWQHLLTRVEEVAAETDADWYIFHDADERRSGPWPGKTLREALWEVTARGFNAVNHTILEFHPTDDRFCSGTDYEAALRYWAGPRVGANRTQIKAWHHPGGRVDIHTTGGHEAVFEGRRLFPYFFLLKHYPVRSQPHGEKKVLQERKPRWDPTERKRLWHNHYDHVRRGHNFLKDPAVLTLYDESFHTDLLAERLTGEISSLPAPNRARRLVVGALRATHLRGAAVAVRRWYWIARRRDVETGQT
jgi:glycosyltransferase involved in cell wall biosynthesis